MIFDINTIKGLKHWSKVDGKKGELTRKGFSNKKQTASLAVYYKNKLVLKVSEITFKISKIKQILKKAGFKRIETEPDKDGRRVFFVAEKGGV